MTLATLDPTQLRLTTDCPSCRRNATFTPRGVFGQYWMKRCTACGHYKHWRLPRITKKIIYLDQLVISNMVKSQDVFWRDLQKKLGTLSGLDLIVCPYSDVHREESLLSHALRDTLKSMYRSFGGNDHFRDPVQVEQSQLLRSIRAFLGLADADAPDASWRDAFEADPHRWTGDFQVFADSPIYEPWVTDLRTRKQAVHSGIENVCDFWRTNPAKFKEDVAEEVKGYGRANLQLYRSVAHASRFDPNIPPGLQPGVMLIHWLAREVLKARPQESQPVSIVERFFDSKYVRRTPFLEIASRLWATIAQRVRSRKGQRTPKESDTYDVVAISRYAPYCDAMFVDNEFRGMASQKNVDVPGKYGVRLFSVKTRDAFVAYLDDIMRNMSDAHQDGLALLRPQLTQVFQFFGRKEAVSPCRP